MTTIKVESKTHERLRSLGAKDETFDQIIARLLNESEYLQKLQAALFQCETDVEQGKQRGHLPMTVADDLIRTVREFIRAVESR